ncbi:TPA: hypothetical protein ACYLN4_000586 [Burkholderia lata]
MTTASDGKGDVLSLRARLERVGLITPKSEITGTVRRIGFVATGAESAGYYAIQFVELGDVHRVFALRDVAETLALTLPGEKLNLTIKKHTNFVECISASRT